MKMRIHKLEEDDHVVFEVFPWHLKPIAESDTDFMDRMTIKHQSKAKDWIGREYHDIDKEQLPQMETRQKWYANFSHPTEKIKVDHNWEYKKMPVSVIREKHLSKLGSELEYVKTKTWTDAEWYEQALKNLDARVANGEPDKPVIREKLLAKIQQLKNK